MVEVIQTEVIDAESGFKQTVNVATGAPESALDHLATGDVVGAVKTSPWISLALLVGIVVLIITKVKL